MLFAWLHERSYICMHLRFTSHFTIILIGTTQPRLLGVPTSEVGYISATAEGGVGGGHEVWEDMWWHLKKKLLKDRTTCGWRFRVKRSKLNLAYICIWQNNILLMKGMWGSTTNFSVYNGSQGWILNPGKTSEKGQWWPVDVNVDLLPRPCRA